MFNIIELSTFCKLNKAAKIDTLTTDKSFFRKDFQYILTLIKAHIYDK